MGSNVSANDDAAFEDDIQQEKANGIGYYQATSFEKVTSTNAWCFVDQPRHLQPKVTEQIRDVLRRAACAVVYIVILHPEVEDNRPAHRPGYCVWSAAHSLVYTQDQCNEHGFNPLLVGKPAKGYVKFFYEFGCAPVRVEFCSLDGGAWPQHHMFDKHKVAGFDFAFRMLDPGSLNVRRGELDARCSQHVAGVNLADCVIRQHMYGASSSGWMDVATSSYHVLLVAIGHPHCKQKRMSFCETAPLRSSDEQRWLHHDLPAYVGSSGCFIHAFNLSNEQYNGSLEPHNYVIGIHAGRYEHAWDPLTTTVPCLQGFPINFKAKDGTSVRIRDEVFVRPGIAYNLHGLFETFRCPDMDNFDA